MTVHTDSRDSRQVKRALDGGWGWVVCVSCFVVHLLTDGLLYSFGILFAELLRFFQQSRSETAWIISIFQGITFCEGPLAAALVNRLGCRITAVVGTILLAGGYLTSMFAPNIYLLYLTIGVIAGCGNGLLFFSAIVCVSQYFEEKRSLATGIGVSGSGIGTFLFGPVITFLIEKYTWKGAILIQSGIVLHGLACALIFRPLDYQNPMRRLNSQIRATQAETLDAVGDGDMRSEHIQMLADNKEETFDRIDCSRDRARASVDKDAKTDHLFVHDYKAEDGIRVDVNAEQTDASLERVSNSETDTDCNIHKKQSRGLCSYIDTELLHVIPFDMFVISSTIGAFGFFVPYIFLPDKARDQGIDPERTAWLIAAIGISNTCSRVLFGFLADRASVNRLLLYNVTFIVYGACTALVPLCHSFELLLIYAVIFGSLSGTSVCLRSVILTDIVGIRKLPNAFGICNFFTGVMVFVAPPLAGWLADTTGSYTATFVTGGITLVLAGVLLLLIPSYDNRDKMNKDKR